MAGGIDWFRWHHGSVTDPKFQLVARRSGASLPDVLAVWAYLLETASAAEQRGHFGTVDCESWDCLFNFPNTETRTADIMRAFEERNLTSGGSIVAWERRQPKRERETQGNASNDHETPRNASTKRVQAFRDRQRTGSEGTAGKTPAPPGSEIRSHETPRNAETAQVVARSESENHPGAGSTTGNHETPRNAMKRQKQPRGEESREEKNTNTGGQRASAPDTPPSGGAPPDFLEFVAKERPDLDPAVVWANVSEHYRDRPGKLTEVAWRKWVRREQHAATFGSPSAGLSAPPITVPGRPGRDPVLQRLEADAKRATPPPPAVQALREKLKAGKPQPAEVAA